MEENETVQLPGLADRTPVPLSTEDRELIEQEARAGVAKLEHNYIPGFGVFPSGDPEDNFYNQVWTRDFSHAGGTYFATHNPAAFVDSLRTILSYQRTDGSLPLRVEREYLLLKVVPGLRILAKPLFELIEHLLKGRTERPVYEGESFSSAEDTVPITIAAIGELVSGSETGRAFVAEHFEQLRKAITYFEAKIDPIDSLASCRPQNTDWADSINRGGKLGGVNIAWARALSVMSVMAHHLGHLREAEKYQEAFGRVQRSVMEKLYNKEKSFFRAEEGKERIDTVASIFGALFLLSPAECVQMQETFKLRILTKSGLKNFDPPYPRAQILWPHRLIGHEGYHNRYVWPWVTCQNIQVKIKIALQHPDSLVRQQYKREAVEDLCDNAKLFDTAGGAYEIFHPDTRQPVLTRWYTPPKNLMANLATYENVYDQLKKLGWLPPL